MSKIYIKKDGDDFKVFDGDDFIGNAEKKNYPKDQKFGYIWKLPKNSAERVWVSAGLMKDGLELEPHVEKVVGTSGTKIENSYAIFDKIKDQMAPADVEVLDKLKAYYIKLAKKVEIERQIAALQKMREELGL